MISVLLTAMSMLFPNTQQLIWVSHIAEFHFRCVFNALAITIHPKTDCVLMFLGNMWTNWIRMTRVSVHFPMVDNSWQMWLSSNVHPLLHTNAPHVSLLFMRSSIFLNHTHIKSSAKSTDVFAYTKYMCASHFLFHSSVVACIYVAFLQLLSIIWAFRYPSRTEMCMHIFIIVIRCYIHVNEYQNAQCTRTYIEGAYTMRRSLISQCN